MAAFAKPRTRLAHPFGRFEQLEALLARELAPSARKHRTALRLSAIATIGAGLVAICHVKSGLGTYVVWLLAGAGPMMSAHTASAFLAVEAIALFSSVVMARALAETPWLMLPFLFALVSFSTYAGTTRKLGAGLLLIQVVCLDTFFGVVFAPSEIGWSAAGAFGSSIIGFGLMVVFDNWLWPDPGEITLMEALGASLARANSRFAAAAKYYLDGRAAPRPPLPPATSDLPAHLTLLDQAVAEGISAHRHAVLLAAITRVARIGLEMDRLIVAARETVPHSIRAMARAQIQAAVDAIAAALSEIAAELPTGIAVGADVTPAGTRSRARPAMDALSARIIEIRPAYIGTATPAEILNFASFTDSLAALTGHVERLLDEPPQPASPVRAANSVGNAARAPDPAAVRHSLKVGLCVVIGYLIGVLTHRADLSTILTTIIVTALPTYGASVRKMILRIAGAIIGGAVSLLAIIIITPNFETLPVYLMAVFVVFWISAYSSLSSGRIAYAGKQIGVTFALVFTGLSPALDIYGPLWRIWGIVLGTLAVAIVALIVWPVYAGDSLLPRLQKVIRETLALAGPASRSENQIQAANSGTMRILAEILQVADDAQMEGGASRVNHAAIVEAAGTLRRIANRLASVAIGRIATPMPPLDAAAESARGAVFDRVRRQLQSWLGFFSGVENLTAAAAQAIARTHPPNEIEAPRAEFSSRLEEHEYAIIQSWTIDQRRTILAELQSMRRLEFLTTELNRSLAQIPGAGQGT